MAVHRLEFLDGRPPLMCVRICNENGDFGRAVQTVAAAAFGGWLATTGSPVTFFALTWVVSTSFCSRTASAGLGFGLLGRAVINLAPLVRAVQSGEKVLAGVRNWIVPVSQLSVGLVYRPWNLLYAGKEPGCFEDAMKGLDWMGQADMHRKCSALRVKTERRNQAFQTSETT